jgi:hypothetical protein
MTPASGNGLAALQALAEEAREAVRDMETLSRQERIEPGVVCPHGSSLVFRTHHQALSVLLKDKRRYIERDLEEALREEEDHRRRAQERLMPRRHAKLKEWFGSITVGPVQATGFVAFLVVVVWMGVTFSAQNRQIQAILQGQGLDRNATAEYRKGSNP